ncbi:hypothetical protein [Longimicrobium sp.]|uniref:hypothetical protein n=1 Tax=Longimicrobium sp. TaxID=2029185 RepID=UPI002E36F8FF|nr:hypothetical protein [Longimicrobium sp.]HEX6041913.1 hypothetical protein [Longimicrobium sp.]
MYKKLGTGLVAALLLAGCSGGGDGETGKQAQSRPDSAAAPPPAHDMSAMGDSAATNSAGGMAGMDHSQMGGASPAGGAMPGMDHSQMGAGAGAGGGAGMDHSRMNMGQGSTGGWPGWTTPA